MASPIKPDEVQPLKNAALPEEVIQVFNDLIVRNWDGREATVVAGDAAKAIADVLNITTNDVYDRNLLDVEEIYRQEGWGVEFDQPAYNENYRAKFIFRKSQR